jgi:small subunit ribosomal protein S26e
MPKKIVRRKGNKGKNQRVICDSCGKKIPRDKSIRVRKHSIPLDAYLINKLESMGARIHTTEVIIIHCLSCAKHRKII